MLIRLSLKVADKVKNSRNLDINWWKLQTDMKCQRTETSHLQRETAQRELYPAITVNTLGEKGNIKAACLQECRGVTLRRVNERD